MSSNKTLGDSAELRFMLEARQRGWRVSKPFGDAAPYDVIVDTGRKLLKVQVKSTAKKLRQMWRVRVGTPTYSYTLDDCDLIACFIAPLNSWYLLPVNALGSGKYAVLNETGQYARFLEAWDNLLSL